MTDREGAPRKEGDRPPRPDRPKEGQRGAMADPKVLFERLDRDKNGSLSLDEFTGGMRFLRSALTTPLPSPEAIRTRTKTEVREGAAKDRDRPRDKEAAKDRDRPRDKEGAKDREQSDEKK